MEFSRRTFLKLASLAGVTWTTAKTDGFKNLVPWVIPPENLPPVVWNTLATTCRECPAGCGMHIKEKDGRITKAEGNPDHPVNKGGLCGRGQSALQGIYDPDRVRRVGIGDRRGHFRDEEWQNAINRIGAKLAQSNGKVAIMSRLETGTLSEIMSGFLKAFGSDRLLYYEAFNYEPLRKANAALFGRPVVPNYHLDRCEYIISFSADFLETWVSNVDFARQFADMRSLKNGKIGAFDYVGPRFSMTATNADNFFQVSPGDEISVALGMLKIIHDNNLASYGKNVIGPLVAKVDINSIPVSRSDLEAMSKRFISGLSVALAGPVSASGPQAERLALAVALLNYAAGRVGTVIDLDTPHALSSTASEEGLSKFLDAVSSEDILFVNSTNPVYSRPGTLNVIQKADTIVYVGTMANETAAGSDWFLPANYYLESWGDYEPWAGIFSLIQPTMAPLADSLDAGDIFLELAHAAGKQMGPFSGRPEIKNSYEWVRERWKELHPAGGGLFESSWEKALRRGGRWPEKKISGNIPSLSPVSIQLESEKLAGVPGKNEAELWLWPLIMFFDGRTANRSWIQEAPEPVTTITWDSWIDVHPEKAKELGIKEHDIIELASEDGSRQVAAPARVSIQVHRDAVALALGQGHTALGRNAADRGANGFLLLPHNPKGQGYFGRVTIRNTGRKEEIVRYINTSEQHNRDLMRWKKLEEVRTMEPGPMIYPLPQGYKIGKDVFAPHENRGHRWAMAVDLQRCIGCGACAIACKAENNVPMVNKNNMVNRKIMAWLNIIPYFKEEDPLKVGWLPLLCQHCDAAPCEPVCPVFASVHNEEGLNAQIYNRCVGTRYCENNCPYKVRRFNWFNHHWPEALKWQLNPEVTVRCRGVMEKCTFCVQRIRNAEYRARREDRRIRDGEIQPACAQSCPTRVYTFGDLMDPRSEVSRITFNDVRRYQLLQELNTKPAITYLYRIEQEK